VNNDTGSNYDRESVIGSASGAVASFSRGGTSWSAIVAGSSATSGEVGSIDGTIPFYTATTFHKQGSWLNAQGSSVADGNNNVLATSIHWRNTAAITRMKIAANSGNLVAGSSLIIYGVP
jgi:hypothetical protein